MCLNTYRKSRAKKVGISDAGRSDQLVRHACEAAFAVRPWNKEAEQRQRHHRKHHRAPNLPPDQHRRQQDSNSTSSADGSDNVPALTK